MVTKVPLAIVQHANQFLITDGYENREGITDLLRGYVALLRLHLDYHVPLNLHLSGTLIEAIAWHSPTFFDLIHELRDRGLLEVIGSGVCAEYHDALYSPSTTNGSLKKHYFCTYVILESSRARFGRCGSQSVSGILGS